MTDSEIGPDDTLDGDYGRLLERATEIYVKRVTSPRGIFTWTRAVSAGGSRERRKGGGVPKALLPLTRRYRRALVSPNAIHGAVSCWVALRVTCENARRWQMLDLVANACGVVGFFMLARRTDDKFWRTSGFVPAALNLGVLVLRLFT